MCTPDTVLEAPAALGSALTESPLHVLSVILQGAWPPLPSTADTVALWPEAGSCKEPAAVQYSTQQYNLSEPVLYGHR